jgi:hypothetical protein
MTHQQENAVMKEQAIPARTMIPAVMANAVRSVAVIRAIIAAILVKAAAKDLVTIRKHKDVVTGLYTTCQHKDVATF